MCYFQADSWTFLLLHSQVLIRVTQYSGLNVSPKNLYVENIISKVMVLWSRACRGWLGHNGEVFMNEISALIKVYKIDSTEFSCLFSHVKIQEVCIPEEGPHLIMMALWSQTFIVPRTMGNKFLLITSYPICGIIFL